MRVIVNDKEIIFPTSLSEFTLGQRIAFQEEHGNLLDEMLKSIMEMDDELLKQVELVEFHAEKMFRTFAFFAGTTAEAIKESKFIEEVARIYHSGLAVLLDDEENLEAKRSFLWNNEEWVLPPVELKHGDEMSFGELIDSKQVVKDMVELSRSKWEYMLPLCAIYLRKKGEAYSKEFLYEGSERLELMKSLPMDIALQVGFFLSATLNIYINTSTYSENQEASKQGNIQEAIMTDMVG